jgi:hypothetical protein
MHSKIKNLEPILQTSLPTAHGASTCKNVQSNVKKKKKKHSKIA